MELTKTWTLGNSINGGKTISKVLSENNVVKARENMFCQETPIKEYLVDLVFMFMNMGEMTESEYFAMVGLEYAKVKDLSLGELILEYIRNNNGYSMLDKDGNVVFI